MVFLPTAAADGISDPWGLSLVQRSYFQRCRSVCVHPMLKKHTLITSPWKASFSSISWGLRPVVRAGLVLCSGAHEGFPYSSPGGVCRCGGPGALQGLGMLSASASHCSAGLVSATRPGHRSIQQCGSAQRGCITILPQHTERNHKARQAIWYKSLSKWNCSSLGKKKKERSYLPTASVHQVNTVRNN